MQGIYTHIPEINYVPREYSVAAILLLLFMVLTSLVSVLSLLCFYISTYYYYYFFLRQQRIERYPKGPRSDCGKPVTMNCKDTSFRVMAGTAVFAAIRVCRESGSMRIILQLTLRFLLAIFKYGAGSVCLLLAGTRPPRLANTLLYKLSEPTGSN